MEQEQTGGLSISYRQLSDRLLNILVNFKCIQMLIYQTSISWSIRDGLRGVCDLLRRPMLGLSDIERQSTHVGREKNVHPETQSTHSVALSVEEKVAQLRRRIKFHWKDKSFNENIKVLLKR